MRTVEIEGTKYHVVQRISQDNKRLVDVLEERYKEQYSDFTLLKNKGGVGIGDDEPHYLLCRRIDDADFEEITEEG